MISGSIGLHGRFRLWCDKSERYGFQSAVDLPFFTNDPHSVQHKTLALEVMIPRGARVLYGLLGIRYDLTNEGRQVDFYDKVDVSSIYLDSLVKGFETVRFGLPIIYSEASIYGLKRYFELIKFKRSGVIEICGGAFGDVSSNELVFKKIGFVLGALTSLPDREISDEVVKHLLGEDLSLQYSG